MFEADTNVIPKAFGARVTANNAIGDEIILVWLAVFSNLCETDTFAIGDDMGWMVFVSTRERGKSREFDC